MYFIASNTTFIETYLQIHKHLHYSNHFYISFEYFFHVPTGDADRSQLCE